MEKSVSQLALSVSESPAADCIKFLILLMLNSIKFVNTPAAAAFSPSPFLCSSTYTHVFLHAGHELKGCFHDDFCGSDHDSFVCMWKLQNVISSMENQTSLFGFGSFLEGHSFHCWSIAINGIVRI